MKRIFIALIFMAFTLSLFSRSEAVQNEISINSLRDSKACLATAREPDFGDILEIPEPLKDLIIEYRTGWHELCAGTGNGSLYLLYYQSKEIEKGFSSVFTKASKVVRDADENEGREARFEVAEEIHSTLSTRYPSFVPLFKGSYLEHEYFKSSLSDFRKYAPFGDAEDSLFFKEYFHLRGETLFNPWISGTWDYGGCRRFGEYQWVDTIEKIDFLKKNLTKPLYLEVVLEFESHLKKFFDGLYFRLGDGRMSDICTCGDKSAVERDLNEILQHIVSKPGYEETADTIRKTLKGIHENIIIINSEAEKHCSGG